MQWKWIIAAIGASACVAAWSAVAVGYFMHASLAVFTGLATVAALSTEAMFWCLAAALGISIVQARHRIFGWFAGPFRRKG
jgi:hypothetical protein